MKFKETGAPEDELAYLRAKIKDKPEPETNQAVDIAKAIADAMEKKNLPVMRKTKTSLDTLVLCDEVILERSENGKGDFRLVETLRPNVKIHKKNLPIVNQSILRQERVKVYIPQEGKDKFIKQLSQLE